MTAPSAGKDSAEPMLLRRPNADGRPSFLIAGDDAAMCWLAGAFRALSAATPFRIGDGLPVGSDGTCLITVAAARRGDAALSTPSAGLFQWRLPAAEARRYADLIDAMVRFSGPCHHYLETDAPGLPVVLVSKGEYGRAALNKMLAASRSDA